MLCPKCGTPIEEGMTNCPNCNYEIISDQEYEKKQLEEKQNINESSKMNGWQKTAIISFIISLICIFVGFYKMYIYDEYEYINAYVGGDAYNYIINGTYAVAFFVLATMFMMCAIGCVIIYYISQE